MSKILVTGCAGFIGSHLTDQLLISGYKVCGIDNFNDYYDPRIKEKNLRSAIKSNSFKLYRGDILDFEFLVKIFKSEKPSKIIHLAARTGVRPSIIDPQLYTQVNLLGTINLLKLAVDFKVEQFIFASSSSVYGNSKRLPFRENDPCENIISPYGASKRAAELFVETFHRDFKLKSVILRLFTVYGPRGRPDMAPALFTSAILKGEKINQFGDGTSSRDYTYVDDIVDGIMKTIRTNLKFEIINLGNNHPVKLADFIKVSQKVIGKKAKINKLAMQVGDVERTWASIEKAKKLLSWKPKVILDEGLKRYVNSL